MGQAKKRGSYEERKAAAVLARQEREREEALLRIEAKARQQQKNREIDRLYFEKYGRWPPKRRSGLAIPAIMAATVAAGWNER